MARGFDTTPFYRSRSVHSTGPATGRPSAAGRWCDRRRRASSPALPALQLRTHDDQGVRDAPGAPTSVHPGVGRVHRPAYRGRGDSTTQAVRLLGRQRHRAVSQVPPRRHGRRDGQWAHHERPPATECTPTVRAARPYSTHRVPRLPVLASEAYTTIRVQVADASCDIGSAQSVPCRRATYTLRGS